MEQLNQNIGTRKDLALYRIQTAKSDLNAARILLDAEEYKGANNRAYYAVFHAINAVHAWNGNGYKRHKDVIGNFNKDYVKTKMSLVTLVLSCKIYQYNKKNCHPLTVLCIFQLICIHQGKPEWIFF